MSFEKIIKLILLVGVVSTPIILAYMGCISAELSAIIVALILGISGIFRDWIKSHFYCPQLGIQFNVHPPDCHKTRITYRDGSGGVVNDIPCCYYRLKISNDGNSRAEKIEVMMMEKYTQNQEGQFIKDINFLPLNLKWSHDGVMIRESIAPSLFRYCDFGSISHPEYKEIPLRGFDITRKSRVLLDLDLEIKPNTGSHLVFPGKHRVKIIVVADNSKIVSKIFEVNFNDFWDQDENVMLRDGLNVREVSSLT